MKKWLILNRINRICNIWKHLTSSSRHDIRLLNLITHLVAIWKRVLSVWGVPLKWGQISLFRRDGSFSGHVSPPLPIRSFWEFLHFLNVFYFIYIIFLFFLSLQCNGVALFERWILDPLASNLFVTCLVQE